MATPSYTTDLTDVVAGREHSGQWYEMSGYTGGGADTDETDYFIQGTGCVSQSMGGKTGVSVGLEYRHAAGDITAFTDNTDLFFFWQVMLAGNAMDTFDQGGLRIYIGSSTGNTYGWKSGGSDFGRNPYGGWQNVAIDPQQTPDYTEGSPTASNYQNFCSLTNMAAAVSKGNMHALDAIRYGRGEIIMTGGDATDGYCTFTELSAANDANDVSFTADTTNADATLTNIDDTSTLYPGLAISGTGIPGSTTIKSITNSTTVEMSANATATNTAETITAQPYNSWGLFQGQPGAYLWKGLLSFGQSGTAVDFRDSNANIVLDICPRVYTTFNKIEINNASSRVDWTGVNISSSTDTLQNSQGSFQVVDSAADVNFDTCVFTDLTTFIFGSGSTIDDTTFRRCGLVTQNDGAFNNCIFEESTASASILSDNPTDLDGCTFVSDGSNHAIEIDTPGTYNLTNHTFTGYASSDGSTGNEAIYNNSGGAVTLNSSGNTGNLYVRNGTSATTNIVQSVDVKIDVQDEGNNAIEGAQVYLQKSASGKQWNYTSDTGNAAGDSDFIITGAIDTDLPSTGWFHVWDKSGNTKQNYRYASWSTATNTTMTLKSEVTGTASDADENVIDSYPSSNHSNDWALGDYYDAMGQGFTGDGSYLSSVDFYASKNNSPTGNVYAMIFEKRPGAGYLDRPNDGDTAIATSDAVDVSTWGASKAIRSFNFTGDDKIYLEDGQDYIVVCQYSDGGATNYISFGTDDTTLSDDDNYYRRTKVAQNWGGSTSYDAIFYVNGRDHHEMFKETGISSKDIEEGDTIRNTTDGSWAVVDEIIGTDHIATSRLQGGTDNEWEASDAYSVHRLAIAYTSSDDKVDIPIFNGQTNATGDADTTYNYGALGVSLPISVRIRSNHGSTKYIPYNTSGTITSDGYSLTAVLSEDEVAT